MIERIQIRNFQKHELLRIKFDPEITAIIGPSDAGKSSILRAIRWVALNRPTGDGFVREGSEEGAQATLWLDGQKIRRTKHGTKENAYELNGDVLRAFGTDVPDEVSNTLKIDEIN